jgi:hypothetical protein
MVFSDGSSANGDAIAARHPLLWEEYRPLWTCDMAARLEDGWNLEEE